MRPDIVAPARGFEGIEQALQGSIPGPSAETYRRAETLWNHQVANPESESFLGPHWNELTKSQQRFAAATLSCIDPRELSGTPRAHITCRTCSDTGLVHFDSVGTPERPPLVSPITGRTDAVCWFCMKCKWGLRRCRHYWDSRLKSHAGEEDYREWVKANPIHARRVDTAS